MTSTLLAFDTATELLSIGVLSRGQVRLHEEAGGALASAALIPAILDLLAQEGLALRDVDCIVFGRGPGAFTGLRTACSVAQGLGFGAGKPVLPVDTLLAVAESARRASTGGSTSDGVQRDGEPAHAAQRVWALLDARMNEIYAAHYAYDGRAWQTLEAPMLTTPDALNERWRIAPPECVAGNALSVFGDRLAPGLQARLAPDALPHASALLSLAPAMLERGEQVDAAHALPLYVREKVAQTTAERDAARAAKLEAAAHDAAAPRAAAPDTAAAGARR